MEQNDFQQQVVRSPSPRLPSAGCSGNFAADPCRETAGQNVTEEYAVGEPDFESWSRLWKAHSGDPEVDGEEWVTFVECIQDHFRKNYENFPDEFYFWADFSGDRTLDMKIAKPTVLRARLLSDLQKYLQMNGQKMWRIRIPIYFKSDDRHRVIVIYPHAIDIPPICQTTATEHSNTSESAFRDLRVVRAPRGGDPSLSEKVLAGAFDQQTGRAGISEPAAITKRTGKAVAIPG